MEAQAKQPQKNIQTMSIIELARLLQEQFQAVTNFQGQIMQHQQNIWSINQELDKRDGEEVVAIEPPDPVKPE